MTVLPEKKIKKWRLTFTDVAGLDSLNDDELAEVNALCDMALRSLEEPRSASRRTRDAERFRTIELRHAEYTGGHISADEFIRLVGEELLDSFDEAATQTPAMEATRTAEWLRNEISALQNELECMVYHEPTTGSRGRNGLLPEEPK